MILGPSSMSSAIQGFPPPTIFYSRPLPQVQGGKLRQAEERKKGESSLKKSPLGLPPGEASGAGASWGRALSPETRHSWAMQMGELEQRGG